MRTPPALNRLWNEAVNLVIGFQAAGGCAKLSTIVDKQECGLELLEGYNLRQAVIDLTGDAGEYDTDMNTIKAAILPRGMFVSMAIVGSAWEVVLWTNKTEVAITHEEPATAYWNCRLVMEKETKKRPEPPPGLHPQTRL